MCEYCIELTQLVWDKRVIVNFMYPPLLRGPPCCKVHQSEDTKFRVGQSHDLPYGVLGVSGCVRPMGNLWPTSLAGAVASSNLKIAH